MRKFICAGALLALLASIAPAPVAAQGRVPCGEKASIVDSLQRRHGEARVVEAVTAGGALLEVFASIAGSWTILVTLPGGPACVVAAGEGWRLLMPVGGKV